MATLNTMLVQVYERIEARVTNPKESESLRRVKQACDYLLENGLKATYPAIERYCLDRGFPGPKAQSIRNSRDVLKAYADACANSQQVIRKKNAVSSGPVIRDESIRAYVQLLEQERDMARASLQRVENALRTLPGVSIDKILATGTLEPGQASSAMSPVLSVQKAVRNLMDAARLKSCGLELAKGRVTHMTTKNVLLEKADVEMLQAYLSETEPTIAPEQPKTSITAQSNAIPGAKSPSSQKAGNSSPQPQPESEGHTELSAFEQVADAAASNKAFFVRTGRIPR